MAKNLIFAIWITFLTVSLTLGLVFFALPTLTNVRGETEAVSSEEVSNRPEVGVVELLADRNDGHDWAWSKRHYYGMATWGIRGSRIEEEGDIWFNEFPGESGLYRVKMRVLLEQDGQPNYSVKAEQRVISKGVFPYLNGKKDCDARGGEGVLDFGVHQLNKGEKITVWGRSVYECPWRKGAYTLWEKLIFTPVDEKQGSEK